MLMPFLEAIRSMEDWRGLLAFTFTLGFFIIFIIEIILNRGFEGSKLLLPPFMIIMGFYFGEKAAKGG
jgi:ABC-type multidrug transport system permease subunit